MAIRREMFDTEKFIHLIRMFLVKTTPVRPTDRMPGLAEGVQRDVGAVRYF